MHYQRSALKEFLAELDAVLDGGRDGSTTMDDVTALLEDWITSLRLQQNPEWGSQMAGSTRDRLPA